MPKLNEEQTNFCEAPITEQEILRSLKDLAPDKTHTSDGLPTDFYKFFWCDVKILLIGNIIYAMEIGELSIKQKIGIITLLQKKGKIESFLKSGDQTAFSIQTKRLLQISFP